MSSLLFFKNVRRDGGIRLGIEVDGQRLFHAEREIPELAAEDPALDWYIDVYLEGRKVPSEPCEVKQWLMTQMPLVQRGLHEFADKLEAGVDEFAFPVRHEVGGSPAGIKASLSCSAIRAIRYSNIAELLRETAKSIANDIKKMPKEAATTHG